MFLFVLELVDIDNLYIKELLNYVVSVEGIVG